MTGLGYKPSAIEDLDGTPVITADIDDWGTGFLFGDCENGKCKYVLLYSAITDLKKPPLNWLDKNNGDYDFGKMYIKDDGSVAVQMSLLLGTDGIPLTTLRYVLSQWRAYIRDISEQAIKDKLIKE